MHITKNTSVDRKEDYVRGELREALFQNVCNGNIKGKGIPMDVDNKIRRGQQREPKCHLAHHFDPFLSIGPFKLEVKFYFPLRTIIHEFFTKKEMAWLMEYSKPRLTSSREGSIDQSTLELTKSRLR